MNQSVVVFEDAGYVNLLPLVYWRSVGELRCGRRLLLERHSGSAQADSRLRHAQAVGSLSRGVSAEQAGLILWVRDELATVVAERFGRFAVNVAVPAGGRQALLINARWLPDSPPGSDGPPAVGVCDGQVAYLRLPASVAAELNHAVMLEPDSPSAEQWAARLGRSEPAGGTMIRYPWDLVHQNGRQLLADWRLFLAEQGPPRIEGRVYDGAWLLDRGNIHVGPGSTVKPCTVLDAEDGPIHIGANVRISPNCTIQGPVAIGDGTLIQPGAVIREGTTIGPVCKVGGEVEESIIWGWSNKQHDGFLGHAVLGAWINIAADSINSDLKNTYGPVRVPVNGVEIDSGQMFVGLTMGDHSKSSINSSFATGTVVGFCSNVLCNAFPPKFVPSFCWITDASRRVYDPARGLEVARKVVARRKMTMTAAEEALFLAIASICRDIERSDPLDG